MEFKNIFKIFNPKYYKTYYSTLIYEDAMASVKLSFNDTYYVVIKDFKYDMTFYDARNIVSIDEAIEHIEKFKKEIA